MKTLTPNSRPEEQVIKIGVLALQGGFAEHISHLQVAATSLALPVKVLNIRTATELNEGLDGLVIPGGESTTMRIVLQAGEKNTEEFRLYEALKDFVLVKHKPVFGTCAGLIMLANEVEGEASGGLIGGLDIKVARNYYGSQPQSFEAHVTAAKSELCPEIDTRMVFIRAPRVLKLLYNTHVASLATWDGSIVAVQQDNILATAFHPELTPDLSWHSYFLGMITNANAVAVKP